MATQPNPVPAVCRTCGKPYGAPFRVYDASGKVKLGCIDECHTGHLVTPSESNWWHNRPTAKLHRAQVKRHLRKLLGDGDWPLRHEWLG